MRLGLWIDDMVSEVEETERKRKTGEVKRKRLIFCQGKRCDFFN